ncbi:MAG TPA: MDR family MFS transporter [Candidatus Limnocylindria bacterium]|nr:MDR family MFS transporter [Candidatus Limnocylindria bacterium]
MTADDARKRRVLFGVMLSVFLAAMESTVVATAMPKVVASLGGINIYSWVFSGFLLTSTVTIPVWGRLSDLVGRRPMYMTGLVLFLLGSALSGLSQTMGQLIVFRMVQGLGAGSLLTLSMTIIADLFGLERRARMQGYISGVWGVASMLGPLMGGLLTDHVSWRWVFYINVPFGALAGAVLWSALLGEARPARRPTIDYVGLALFFGGVSALLLGLGQAGRAGRWSGVDVVGPLLGAALALVAFVAVERRVPEPIVPLRLLRHRMVLAASVTGFLAGMAMFGSISFVPLFLQSVSGMTATSAGFVLTPFVLGWVALSIVSARLVLKVGYRSVVITGMACLTGSFVLLSRWSPGLTQSVAMRDALLGGIGMGMTMVPMLIAVQSAVPRADLGAATSMTQFFRTIGGAVGLSIMGAVMARRLGDGLPMADALHGVFIVGLLVCVAAFASAFLVPAGRAQDLARAEVPGATSRAGGRS